MHHIFEFAPKILNNCIFICNLLGSLTTFKDYLKGALGDSEVKKIISEVSGGALGSLSKAAEDAPSKLSSFGIGIGLTFLGQYLLTKKRGSPAARAIARILGADVNANNRDFALAKLKEPGYLVTIRDNILNALKTKSIDDFALTLELSPTEAWDVYRQIKDMIVDSELIEMLTGLSNEFSDIKATLSSEVQSVRDTIEEKMKTILETAEKTNEYSAKLEMFKLGLELVTVSTLTVMSEGDREKCWKRGHFRDEEIKSGYDARRPITDDIISSIKDNLGTIVYGKEYYGKTIILKRIMFEMIENDGYTAIYAGNGINGDANLLIALFNSVLRKNSKLLVVVDDIHISGSEVAFKAFDKFANRQNQDHIIRFLFGGEKEKLERAIYIAGRKTTRVIDDAREIIKRIDINFENKDAILYLKKCEDLRLTQEQQLSGL